MAPTPAGATFTVAQLLALFPAFPAIKEGNAFLKNLIGDRGWSMMAGEFLSIVTLSASSANSVEVVVAPIDNAWLRGIRVYTALGVPVVDGVGIAVKAGQTTLSEGGVLVDSGGTHLSYGPAEDFLPDNMKPTRLPTSGRARFLFTNYTAADIVTPKIFFDIVDSNGYTFTVPR